jgi:hypothetical protein
VVFEVGMNWHWLFEISERELSLERIVLANPFKTGIIAEAQIKTDKVDARILADLLRETLISSVHVVGRESRELPKAYGKAVTHCEIAGVVHRLSPGEWSRHYAGTASSDVSSADRDGATRDDLDARTDGWVLSASLRLRGRRHTDPAVRP